MGVNEAKKKPASKPKPIFNPAFTTDGLKQWWAGQIKIANKTVKGK